MRGAQCLQRKFLTVVSGICFTLLVSKTAEFLFNVIPIVVKMNGDAVSGNVLRYMYVGVFVMFYVYKEFVFNLWRSDEVGHVGLIVRIIVPLLFLPR